MSVKWIKKPKSCFNTDSVNIDITKYTGILWSDQRLNIEETFNVTEENDLYLGVRPIREIVTKDGYEYECTSNFIVDYRCCR